jgi:hypothetical protein
VFVRVGGGGNLGLTPSEGVDGVDVPLGVVVHRVGYFLAIGRVGRFFVVLVIVGDVELAPTADLDGEDLPVTVEPV